MCIYFRKFYFLLQRIKKNVPISYRQSKFNLIDDSCIVSFTNITSLYAYKLIPPFLSQSEI